jgi:hypothetical protein
MRNSMQRVFAVICGVVTVGMPAVAAAEVPCPTYFQVQSSNGGGEWVGGILFSESTLELSLVTNETKTTTTSGSLETEVKYPTGSLSGSGSHSTTTIKESKTVVSGEFNVGVYKMNDGTTWLVNCDTNTQIGSIG